MITFLTFIKLYFCQLKTRDQYYEFRNVMISKYPDFINNLHSDQMEHIFDAHHNSQQGCMKCNQFFPDIPPPRNYLIERAITLKTLEYDNLKKIWENNGNAILHLFKEKFCDLTTEKLIKSNV